MGWTLASIVTYASFLVDGNQLTNLLSIGEYFALAFRRQLKEPQAAIHP